LFERLSADHGVPDELGTRIQIHLTHAEIASLVSSTRETVSLEMGKLVRAGRLLSSGGFYLLPTTQKLSRA